MSTKTNLIIVTDINDRKHLFYRASTRRDKDTIRVSGTDVEGNTRVGGIFNIKMVVSITEMEEFKKSEKSA